MSPPRVYKTEAVVLRQRRLGEAERIVTLYSADRGKFDAVAKGVRRPGSRKAGHLEPLTRTSVMLAHGRSLDIITQCEAVDMYLPLRDDRRRLACGLYVAELVDRCTVEQSESFPIYRLLVQALSLLSTLANVDAVLRFFEMNLLSLAGYQPELRHCVQCRSALLPVVNSFSPVAGGVVCPSCTPAHSGLRPITVTALKVLRLLQGGRLADAVRLRLDHDLAIEVEGHLASFLRVSLDQDLRSLPFMLDTRRESPSLPENAAVLS